jgi:organic radical activating enzyme
MGNYQTDGLAAVWKGEKYRHIRKTLLSGDGLEPYCASCEYRFGGPSWLLQLHLGLWAYQSGCDRDPEVVGLIRRWADRHSEYARLAPGVGLNVYPLPDLPGLPEGEAGLNLSLPEVLIDAGALPVYVDFNTLNRCNVSCTMCPPAVLFDDQGVKRDPYYRLSIEEFEKACDSLTVKTAHFVGAYAEPLLNKDIFRLIHAAKTRGAFTAITTNATVLIPRFADRLLDAGLDMMTVSLHGATKATAEAIMRKADFDRVIRNIRDLQEQKSVRGVSVPEIYFNFVSQRANVKEIPDFISLAADLGVRHIHIIHLIDGGLQDKSINLVHYPELLGPAIVEAKRRAAELGVNAYISPAYTDIVEAYEAALSAGVSDGDGARRGASPLSALWRQAFRWAQTLGSA